MSKRAMKIVGLLWLVCILFTLLYARCNAAERTPEEQPAETAAQAPAITPAPTPTPETTPEPEPEPVRHTKRQMELHELANMAREMGLPEDNPIIVEAKRLWLQEEQDLRILAKVVRNEAGYCTDRHQQLVAQVVLNRVASPLFPDNVKDVVNAPGQYNPIYTRNLPEWDTADEEQQRAFRNALAAMNGEVDCPADVLFQSEFPKLGKGNYETITVDTGWFRSTTYFNYG